MKLRKIYNKDLKLTYKLNCLQKCLGKQPPTGNVPAYSINEIAYYLSCTQLIAPTSIKQAVASRSKFITDWRAEFSLEYAYRYLDFPAMFKE